ncbi:MAG: efflux RND transporter periplasmic adaptor subunit [Candidatus Rhabdochlamydia sp.]
MKMWMILIVLCSCSSADLKPPSYPYVRTDQAASQDVLISLRYVGHIKPNLQVSLKSQVSGLLQQSHFIEGKEVNAGDILLTLDSRPFEVLLQECEAQLAHNLVLYQQAQDTVARYDTLNALSYISSLEYENLQTQVSVTKALVQQSEAAVLKARLDLSYCTLTAPFQGVTSQLYQDPGSYITAGDQSCLLTLNQINPIRLTFHVPEHHLALIAPLHHHHPLTVKVKYQDEWIEGVLLLIDNAIDEATGTLLLQALFENDTHQLWPGMFVDVELILTTEKNAITVPSVSVFIGQKGSYVYVLKADQTVELREVETGQNDLQSVVIRQGITAGETVIIEGQINLTPGCQVQVKR